MDLAGALILLVLGFMVGISGALMPGPLLVYTIQESFRRGKWTGILVIAGHAIVEVFIFVAIMLGLSEFMTSRAFTTSVSVLGGIALILMAASTYRTAGENPGNTPVKQKYGTIVGGIIFTAFNPGFPLWWATAGTRLMMEGLERMGFAGMLLVFLGHWGADLGWFTLVSMLTAGGSKTIFEKGWYRGIRIILSIALLALGIYFLSTAF